MKKAKALAPDDKYLCILGDKKEVAPGNHVFCAEHLTESRRRHRLREAAPDLLAVLKDAVSHCSCRAGANPIYGDPSCSSCVKAEAAIKAAEEGK